ncbi:membrane-associated progesterone receptor component 1 [Drosophila takahashii]|uniref:membrane-associated progesterone receptor component 1 n=1 Tax=Drosophila takahashii TaxID=29030 RepID=UPI001CF8D22A|nr:membrane-associated progesterone receptor component 1 [Drosophila takahashii]
MNEELADLGCMVSIVLTFCAAVLGYLYVYHYQLRTGKRSQLLDVTRLSATDLPDLPPIKLTLDQLLGFDGTRSDGRILVALRGKIYDVSSDFPEFGLNGTLSHVAGRDFTYYLTTIMEMHNSEVNYVDRWEDILETNYSRVGIVIDDLGNPLIETFGNTDYQNTEIVEEDQKEMVEAESIGATDSATIISNVKLNKTLNGSFLTAESLPSDSIPQKYFEEPNSDLIITAEISDC